MSEQLFQIGVKALVTNKNGEILMLQVPEWDDNPAHWDLPGGRMEPGESFLQTLKRELEEEIGVSYIGQPKQIMGMLTSITIPIDDKRVPLVFMIYEVQLPKDVGITLDPNGAEKSYEWFVPTKAAEHMAIKFSEDFRDIVRALPYKES